MDTNPNKQPIRGSQPDPRTRFHRKAQSVIPQSVTPQSEAHQSVSPQSEPSQTVSPQSASPQTQSHLENPQSKSVSPQTVQKLSEAAQRAIDPTGSMTDVVAQSGRNLVACKILRRLLNSQETKEMWHDDEVINCYFGHLMARANTNRDFPKLCCFTSHFFESAFPDLCARNEKLFDMDVILIPLNVIKNH